MRVKEFINTIQGYNYFPNYSKWIFGLVFIVMSFVYGYQDLLFNPPQSLHIWRQCDCLSITMNYYQDNNPFLEPAVHHLGNDCTGKTVSDFPMIYYFVSKLWKVFGHNEYIYRVVVLLFFLSGLFALYKIFENLLKDSILAIICSLFLYTSPTLVYYAGNFLMNIPALSCAFIGLYFFFRFCKTSKYKHLLLFAFFYAIGGLLKIPSLLSFIAICGLFILEVFNLKLNDNRKIFQYPLKQAVPLVSVFIIQLVWYVYARDYNFKHNGGMFLIGTLPIWALDISQIKITLDAIWAHVKWDYFRIETQIVLGVMLVFIFTFYKRIDKKVLLLVTFISIGFLLFVLLFFQALKNHDYYTINLFILVPILMLGFLLILKDKFKKVYNSIIFRIILILFLIHNVDFAKSILIDRFHSEGWQNRDYIKYFQPYYEISPYLRSIGIEESDKVICFSDNSINISLYFMNQKGWTKFGLMSDSLKIQERIDQGAKYLFIHKKESYEDKSIHPFIKNKIGDYKNIDIYSLEKSDH